MRDNLQEALKALKKLDTPKSPTAKTAKTKVSPHNTAAALREGLSRGCEKSQTRERPIAKTAKITSGYKTEAEALGLVATWAHEFGHISLHDPTTGEWHDLKTQDAPGWAVGEAHRRKGLYKAGNRGAYRLTSGEMEEIWETGHPDDEGIVEDHSLEEEN
jgi:hypothetical protein